MNDTFKKRCFHKDDVEAFADGDDTARVVDELVRTISSSPKRSLQILHAGIGRALESMTPPATPAGNPPDLETGSCSAALEETDLPHHQTSPSKLQEAMSSGGRLWRAMQDFGNPPSLKSPFGSASGVMQAPRTPASNVQPRVLWYSDSKPS